MSTTQIQRWPVEVSIIIPVFNKADLTDQCLERLALTTRVPHEVIVVDNASTDSTPQLLASRKAVRGIRNDVNRGFAGACNQGAAAARGRHLLFLNNDTLPFPEWLEQLVQEFRRHPEVAAVGSKLIYASGLVQHAGVAFGRETRSPFHPHRGLQSDDPRVNRRRELQAVTAACMLLRREWFERCGGFNEEYRNGYEDLDLCLNIRRQGGLIVYQPKSTVYHLESQTPGRMKFDDENRALFFKKWADWLLADEDACYLADDYKIIYRREQGRTQGRLMRITDEQDRESWKIVAQVQRLAAEGKWAEVRPLLDRTDAWPEDAAVRRWAATICYRTDREAAGNAHLRKSLELETSPDALLQLAQSDPGSSAALHSAGSPIGNRPDAKGTEDAAGSPDAAEFNSATQPGATLRDGQGSVPTADGTRGVSSQVEGFGAFLAGNYTRAVEAFESALAQGLNSREALFGLAAAAFKAGDAATARQCCDALLARQKGDPLAKRLLEQLETAQTTLSAREPTGRVEADVSSRTEAHESPLPGDGAVAEFPKAKPVEDKAVSAPCLKPASSSPAGGSDEPLVSIIILALNQLEHTRACLESLAAHTGLPHEVIVVDNGSTDGTAEYLQNWQAGGPNRLVIRNPSNRGFAAGNNQGLALARGGCVVLLNNDTVVTDGWLEGLLAVLRRQPGVGVVGPMSNCVCGPQLVSEVDYPSLAELPAFAERWRLAHAGESFEIPRAVGFCVLARREVIERIGGLDERFGSGNFEDDDFCLRVRFAGFGIRIAKEVFIHHAGSQTFKGAKIDYRQAMLRNWALFRAKWQLPTETRVEQGYRPPSAPPPGLSLQIPLRPLATSHETSDGRVWTEKQSLTAAPALTLPAEARPAPGRKTAPLTLPPCALVGHLAGARELCRQRKLPAAWKAALATLEQRPFHPEAYLLLAEIALAAGAGEDARRCAEHARRIAPGFKAAKKCLQQRLKGGARPSWLVCPEEIRNPKSEIRNRLSVCLIVKNEEQFLGQCLQSVRDLASQIVVVDTGSTDRTVEIAREHGAEVHSFAWCDDFSAARNAALEHATGDWVLMLDADEELSAEGREKLKQAMAGPAVMAWRLPIVNVGREAEGCSYVPRLFRNAPALFYLGRVHEQVFSSLEVRRAEWGLENRIGDATLVHHGYTAELTRDRHKIERNLRLLERAIEELPGEPHLLMNLGLELARSGREAEALTRYLEAFEGLSSKPAAEIVPELRETLLSQLCTRLTAARRFDEIVRALNAPLARANGGLTASLHFSLGLAHFELRQFSEAADQMRQCLAKRGRRSLSPINQDILTAAPQHCLAVCLAQLGDVAAAEKAFQSGLAETGHQEVLRLDYAKFLVEQGRPMDALQRVNEIVAANANHTAAWRLGGQIALSQPEFLEFARDWTGEAMRYQPTDAVVAAQRAEVLLLSGDTEGARELWEQVCDLQPQPVALAALILCEAIGSPSTRAPEDGHEEVAVSRAFLGWYRKLLATGAQETVVRLNEQTDKLSRALPTAARMLEAAMAEADRGEAVGA